MPSSILIKWTIVIIWNLSFTEAQITDTSPTVLSELETWVNVSFALWATEWSIFEEIYDWKVAISFCIVMLRWLSKRLDHNPKLNSTSSLHFLVLRSLSCCWPKEFRASSTLVDGNEWNWWLWWEIITCSSKLLSYSWFHLLMIKISNWSRECFLSSRLFTRLSISCATLGWLLLGAIILLSWWLIRYLLGWSSASSTIRHSTVKHTALSWSLWRTSTLTTERVWLWNVDFVFCCRCSRVKALIGHLEKFWH